MEMKLIKEKNIEASRKAKERMKKSLTVSDAQECTIENLFIMLGKSPFMSDDVQKEFFMSGCKYIGIKHEYFRFMNNTIEMSQTVRYYKTLENALNLLSSGFEVYEVFSPYDYIKLTRNNIIMERTRKMCQVTIVGGEHIGLSAFIIDNGEKPRYWIYTFHEEESGVCLYTNTHFSCSDAEVRRL